MTRKWRKQFSFRNSRMRRTANSKREINRSVNHSICIIYDALLMEIESEIIIIIMLHVL